MRLRLTVSGRTAMSPEALKWMVFMPPWAANTWSWEPTVSFRTSCSMWMPSAASCCLLTTSPRSACRACSRPTVNDELDPMPLRAGRSPSWWISTPRVMSRNFSDSRTDGCRISSTAWTRSIWEYTTWMRCRRTAAGSGR